MRKAVLDGYEGIPALTVKLGFKLTFGKQITAYSAHSQTGRFAEQKRPARCAAGTRQRFVCPGERRFAHDSDGFRREQCNRNEGPANCSLAIITVAVELRNRCTIDFEPDLAAPATGF